MIITKNVSNMTARVGEYLTDIFNILPTPGVIVLPDSPVFTIVEANDAFALLINRAENGLIGKGFFAALAGESYFADADLERLMEKVGKDGLAAKNLVFKFGKKTAEESQRQEMQLSCSLTPVLTSDGHVKVIVCSFTDVTEIAAIGKSETGPGADMDANLKFLKETQRIARVGSWYTDLRNNTVSWSEMTKEIYEVAEDFKPTFEIVMDFFTSEENKLTFTRLVQKAIELGDLFDVEMQIKTARGNLRWIRFTGKADHQDGQCERIYGVVQDTTEKRNTLQSLIDSQNQLQTLVQSVNGIFWEADATTFEFNFVSDHARDILGFTPDEWLAEPGFWENHIHPDDRPNAVNYCQFQVANLRDHTFDYRMIKADGSLIWIKDVVSVIAEEGKPTYIRGLMVDITEAKRYEELGTLEKSILELHTANDTALNEVLAMYLSGIEAIFPKMQCSLHLVKESRLEYGLSPSLPKPYLDALLNIPIGPLVGSCGTAAFLMERVIVSDIANDPRWKDYRELALNYNLHACWSQPILNSEGVVMATLGFYYNQVKLPEQDELAVIERSAAILKVILENRQKSILLEESSFLMKQGQELAAFGNWQWDIVNNKVQWSDSLYTIYGLDKFSFEATFEGYQALMHPDDKERVRDGILGVLHTKEDIVFEERIVRPGGEIRFLRSWGRVKTDDKGTPVKMVGACLDITESKKIQEQLSASESRLRSIVDTQTNYVIRTDLNGNYTYYNNRYREDFGWIFGNEVFFGKSPMATVIPDHHARVQATSLSCVHHPNQVFQVELDKFAPGGGIRYTFWHFICITNANGEPFEMQCIGLDISDKKKTEDALKRSNERYKYVNKATEDATYDWNCTTDHIRWGEGFTRLFGFEINDDHNYPIEKWKMHIHPSDRSRTMESLSHALKDSQQNRWQSAYQFRKKNGKYAYVQENGYILRDNGGKALRMIGVLRDMTKQKQEEHHLKLLESVITHANDLVIIAAADRLNKTVLNILYTNEAFTRITGYELREVIGKNTLLLNTADPDENNTENIISAIRNGVSIQLETILTKKNGGQFWISLSLNPIEDEKGHITHWVSIGRDITESRRYTRAIEHQNEKLRNIAWMQSHVVRAPLARLMGTVDLLKNYNNSDLENKEFLEHILAAAHELDRIIRDISDKTQSDPWLFMK